MKDEWYGDKRDLVKWSVLLHLAERYRISRILQVAYYRPTEWAKVEIEGEKHPIPPAVLEHFRAVGLAAGLKGRCRIDVIETRFDDRSAYGALVEQAIVHHTEGPQLVFLDPDTGLASSKPGMEHVLEEELAAVWRLLKPGDALVLYQHQTNRNGQPWVEPKRRQFDAALGLPAGSARLASAPKIARDVVFFFVEKVAAK